LARSGDILSIYLKTDRTVPGAISVTMFAHEILERFLG
jgi:hypothetical protein